MLFLIAAIVAQICILFVFESGMLRRFPEYSVSIQPSSHRLFPDSKHLRAEHAPVPRDTPKKGGDMNEKIGRRAGKQSQKDARVFSMTGHANVSTSLWVVSILTPRLRKHCRFIDALIL